jgi:hypothetical protein
VNADLYRMLRDGRWVQPVSAAGVLGIGAAAFLLSYDALHSLALASGVRPGLARIWPGVLDGFIVVATLTVVAAKRAHQPTWYPWALVALFSAASVVFNILHALDRYLTAAKWVAPLVFAMPPVALVLATHLLLQQGVWRRQHTGAAAAMGERPGEDATPRSAVVSTSPAREGLRQPEFAPTALRAASPLPASLERQPADAATRDRARQLMSKPKRPAANLPAPILAGPLAPATATGGCCCASSAPAPRSLRTAPQRRRDAANRPAGRGRAGLRPARLSGAPSAPSSVEERHPGARDALLLQRPGLRGWASIP